MPIFVERFLLPMFAAAVVVVALANPMGFDKTQRVTGSLALILLAYFAAHSIYKRPPTPAVVTGVVQDADTGQSIGEAEVTIVGRGENTTTDDLGNFHLRVSGDVRDGVRIHASKTGYEPLDVTVYPPAKDVPIQLRKK